MCERQKVAFGGPTTMLAAVLLIIMTQFPGCKCGGKISGTEKLAPPLLGDGTPRYTNQQSLQLQGTRVLGTTVWLKYSDEREPLLLAPVEPITREWSAVLSLQDGDNVFYLYAEYGGEVGPPSDSHTITLDTTPPAAPTLIPRVSLVHLPDGTSTITTEIRGSKEADANVLLNGAEVAPKDASTEWRAPVEVTTSAREFTLTSVDLAGNTSAANTFSLTGTTFEPPVLNPIATPVKNPALPAVSGTKLQAAEVKVWVNDAPAVAVAASIGSTSWSYAGLVLSRVGKNFVSAAQTVDGRESASVFQEVVWQPILPPEVTNLAQLRALAASGTKESSVLVSGRVAVGSLCVRLGSRQNDCVVQPMNSDGTFSYAFVLAPGENTLCLAAKDNEGNISAASASEFECITIRRFLGPLITITAPSALTEGPFNITFSVSPDPREGNSASPVSSIEVAVNNANWTAVTVTGNSAPYSQPINPATLQLATGGHTFTVRAANGFGIITTASTNFFYFSGEPLMASKKALNLRPSRFVRLAGHPGTGSVHAVWEDDCSASSQCAETPSGTGAVAPDIFYRDLLATNAAVAVPVLVSIDKTVDGGAAVDALSTEPSVAVVVVNGVQYVHVVWEETGTLASGGSVRKKIAHRILTNDGSQISRGTVTFVGDITGLTDLENDSTPRLFARSDDNRVHVVWRRYVDPNLTYILYSYWTPTAGSGTLGSWREPVVVYEAAGQAFPDLVVDATDNAHIVWQIPQTPANLTGYDIYYRKVSRDGVLGSVINVSDALGVEGESYYPAIALAGTSLWIAWHDDGVKIGSRTPGTTRIVIYKQTADAMAQNHAGAIVQVASKNTNFSASQASWAVSSDGEQLVLAWQEMTAASATAPYRYQAGIKYRVTGANFEGFDAEQSLVNNLGNTGAAGRGNSARPAAMFNQFNNGVYVAWHDDTTIYAAPPFPATVDPLVNAAVDNDIYFMPVSLSAE